MKVKLAHMLFYGGHRYRAGAVVDLPPEAVPKSAVRLMGEAEVITAPPSEPKLHNHYKGHPRRPELARWQLRYGEMVLEEFTDKSACEVARIDLEQNPDLLQERLAEVTPPLQETGDAVS